MIAVILLDMQLSRRERSRSRHRTHQQPVRRLRMSIIAMIAGALPDQLSAALNAGCDAAVTKPYEPPSNSRLGSPPTTPHPRHTDEPTVQAMNLQARHPRRSSRPSSATRRSGARSRRSTLYEARCHDWRDIRKCREWCTVISDLQVLIPAEQMRGDRRCRLVPAGLRRRGDAIRRAFELDTSHVSLWAIAVRRLVVMAKSRPKGGDMKHAHRRIYQREQAVLRYVEGQAPAGALEINQRVRRAHEQAVRRYVYGKRG
jgi:CheY-like chemotaxis protein